MICTSAHAKLNLGLEILQIRPDAFHNINTVFCRISLHDVINIEADSRLSVHCTQLSHVPEKENLVYIAAEKLQREFNVAVGAKITIEKHIPIGAGLGGGSSDAAATLLSLRELWQLECSDEILHRIARSLGADVPYFLHRGAALAGGIGDELEYFHSQLNLSILLVYPNIHVSTAQAYAGVRVHPEGRRARPLRDLALMAENDPSILAHHCVNDFESSVFSSYPELAQIKKSLYDTGAIYAQMSGSGSTVFGLFHNQEAALLSARQYRNEQPFVCTFVNE